MLAVRAPHRGDFLPRQPELVRDLGDVGVLTQVGATDTTIDAELPPGLLGDFLLTIDTGLVPEQMAKYDLTIGAVGPEGPQGLQGPIGLTGSPGANGADGAAGADGADGAPGLPGMNGQDGSSCSVAATGGGAIISCEDGSEATINDGATGPEGPSGPSNHLGQMCPSGAFVAGFDSNGNIVCIDEAVGSVDDLGVVFVTNQTFNGDLGGLQGADDKCNNAAARAGLAGPYVAWLSDNATDAKDRITSQEYHTIAGGVVATSLADLIDGVIGVPINVDALGDTIPVVSGSTQNAWANTTSGGVDVDGYVEDIGCSDWSSTAGMAHVGNIRQNLASWTDGGPAPCSSHYRLYCFHK